MPIEHNVRTPRPSEFLPAAEKDLQRLNADDPRLGRGAAKAIRAVCLGVRDGVPLADLSKYGDMSSYKKLYFGVTTGANTHRVVYRDRSDGNGIEIVEVVAVEQRDAGYVYLLAAQRIGALPVETKPEAARVH